MLKSVNLGLAFVLELCVVAALAYWGFQVGDGVLVKLILGIGAPLVAIVLWGRFMAPRSTTRLTGGAYLAMKFIVFGAGVVALASIGQVTLAIILAVVSIINQILVMVWKQDTGEPSAQP